MPDTLPSDRLLVSVRDAAQLLSVSPRSIERLIADGEIASVKLGQRRLISTVTLSSWIANAEREEATP